MTSRGPNSIYEKRIDFAGIAASQDRRHLATLVELRSVIFKMQMRTLSWMNLNLVQHKSRTAIRGFSLPLQQRYRAVLRKRMELASRRGHRDVQKETEREALPFRGVDLAKSRERADTLSESHLGRLTQELKTNWNLAMQGPVDDIQMRYVTRKVFADFAGWKEPAP